MITMMKMTACIGFLLTSCSLSLTYSFSQGTWTQKASFPGVKRLDAFSFTIGTKGYAGGGGDTSWYSLGDFWEYDAILNTWTQKTNFTGTARWQATSFSVGSKGYVGLGNNPIVAPYFFDDLWEYDPATDTWTQKANFPPGDRNTAVGFSIGSKGYVGTGSSLNNVKYRDFWEYDPFNNTWVQIADLPAIARTYASGFSIGTKGYCGMGMDSTATIALDDFWEYDPTINIWTQKANFPAGPRRDMDGARFTIYNFGYIGTGVPYSGPFFNDFYRFNPANNTWLQIQSLPGVVRVGAFGFSINNRGYIGTGMTNSGAVLNDLWEYSFDSTSAVSEIENNTAIFNIYPNPSTGKVTLQYELPNGEGEGEIILYNRQGAEVKRYKVDNTFKDLLLDNTMLPAGTYFYQLQTSKGAVGTKKMIVVK